MSLDVYRIEDVTTGSTAWPLLARWKRPSAFVVPRSGSTPQDSRCTFASDLSVGRPIAAPLQQCAELLGIHLVTVRELAANIEPYLRADGTRMWSLMQLERQFRPEAYGRRRGGYLDRRRTPATDA